MFKYTNYRNIFIFTLISIFFLILSSPSLFALYGSKDEEMVEDLEKGLRKKEDTQEIETLKRPYLEYNVHNLRDPFEGGLIQKEERQEEKTEKEIEVSEKPPSLSVKGLVWGGAIPQAIINDKVVKIGDVIEEAEIIEIGKEGVTVLYKNRIYKLSSPASNYMSTGKEQADNLQ